MILNKCNFFSKTLCSHVDADVLLPSLPDNECLAAPLEEIYGGRKPWPVLYLLHGALDDHTSWLRSTCVERYAEEAGVAVVMPSGQNGFYTNARYGLSYFDFITEELPAFAAYAFPLSRRREDTFIAGPSMGGYGAAKCALRCPERYAAFADMSGAVDPGELEPRMKAMGFDFFRYDLIWGGADKVKGTRDDVFRLAEGLRDARRRPEAFVYCGTEDGANYDMNLRFYKTLTDCGFAASFRDGHGGHDWGYWDSCIADFLRRISGGRARQEML